jgi:hypothetical protein
MAFVVAVAFAACSKDSESAGDSGKGGSMARFTIKNDYLYAVDLEKLYTFKIDEKITVVQQQLLGFGIETIFPAGDYLFMGAQNGMHIYDIQNPAAPKKVSFTPHFVSYDPVVVQGNYAYVTLRMNPLMWTGRNLLQIYDISNLKAPQLLAEHPMAGPRGLAIDGNKLFICDDVLKVFEVTNGSQIRLLKSFDIEAIDVIPQNQVLYVVAADGFYQYSYDNENIQLISKITLSKENI